MNQEELEQQYRLLRQGADMHAYLEGRHRRRALLAEVLILVCSAVFCATTFASAELYTTLGADAATGRTAMGIASVVIFAFSIALLVCDWKGKASQHHAGLEAFSRAVEEFREHQLEDGSWPDEQREDLNSAYWEAQRNSVPIPHQSFNKAKAIYLRKVEVSKYLSAHPGCPHLVAALVVVVGAVKSAITRSKSDSAEETAE